MGLLDDAIKEHLELKRRHGADPGEVARLEHEALGPARRDPAPAAVEEPVAAEPAPVADDDLYVDDTGEHDEVIAEERLEAPIHHIEPEPEPEPLAREPAPPAQAEAPPAEDVVPADDEPDSEDVLEETPEFLQETPEHDRLWFEQKPPRDFDF
jgi:hypothetical protein